MSDLYSKTDSVDSLSAEQLDLLARTQPDILLRVIEETTVFDVQRLRLLLELGSIEAKRRLQALSATNQGGQQNG